MKRLKVIIILSLLMYAVCIGVPALANETPADSYNKDKISILGDMKVDKRTTGNIVAIIGKVDIQDDVDGDVVAILGDVNVNARVSREVVAVLGKVILQDKAEIGRNVVAIGSIEKAGSAKIHGNELAVNIRPAALAGTISLIILVIATFFVIILGLIIIAVFKDKFNTISTGINYNFRKKFAAGILGLAAATLLMPLLAVTVIAPLLYFVLIFIATVMTCIFIGKLILKMINSCCNTYTEFIAGLAVITVLKAVILLLTPQIGFVAGIVLFLLLAIIINSIGIGVIIDSRLGFSDSKNRLKANIENVGVSAWEENFDDKR